MSAHPFIFGARGSSSGSSGGGVSLAVTVSNITPDNGDTVTITATPSVGFTPTEYTYILFDGVNITLLAQQAGNTFNWSITQAAGTYEVYVLATDGTDYAWNEQQVDVQATYLLGVYPQDVATMFATFRLLGVFNTRLMEIRRTVGATTTVVEIGLDGDYTTLDSPVLAVVTGSSSATTLGEFVAALGYTDVDSLGSPQSAFAVRGYFQLDGSQAWEQLTPTHQPRLVNSGVLEVLDGKGCLRFSGNQWQDYGLITGVNKPANYTTLTVCSVDNTNAQGVFGSRPVGSGKTPFSYGHLWANQPGARSTYLFGNGAGLAQYATVVNTIVTSSIQYHEDYKSSGVDGSQVFSDGLGPLGLTYDANTTNDVSGVATRMLYGRLGDLAGNLMTGRQLFFGVYEADKIADRVGIKQIINSITGQSW